MGDVYMYADETGNLDYETGGKQGATPYFGFGTATFTGPHPDALWGGQALRMHLAQAGLSLPKGFHAKNDSWETRKAVLKEIGGQDARFDFTLLNKANAYPHIREEGDMRLYKMAWYLHFKEIATQVAGPADMLHVIVASFGTKARATLARAALDDVCEHVDRKIILCVWDAPTAWGLQLADYGLWAVQRVMTHHDLPEYQTYVQPKVYSCFTPWGRVE